MRSVFSAGKYAEIVSTAYLDIETDYVGRYVDARLFRDYANHRITVVGVRVVHEESDLFTQLVGSKVTRLRLLQVLEGVRRIVTYNGRCLPDPLKGTVGFDFPVIQANLGVVLDQEFEHTDLVPECWKRGLYGGLKRIEARLGLRRTLPGKDGAWAMQMWRSYIETKQETYLTELLAYNREDVFMLREVELRLFGLSSNRACSHSPPRLLP